jgi:hypothetical protein
LSIRGSRADERVHLQFGVAGTDHAPQVRPQLPRSGAVAHGGGVGDRVEPPPRDTARHRLDQPPPGGVTEIGDASHNALAGLRQHQLATVS